MSSTEASSDSVLNSALASVQAAAAEGKLTDGAVDNISQWLTQDRYASYRPTLLQHIDDEAWQILDDVYWTIIPFGTGGRRGRMYDIGSNAINDRTIGESAQGLADYVNEVLADKDNKSCAIAYDTRHRSRHFAELCASIMVAAGMKVYFLDDYRATPQLSFAVRHFRCDCGIMVTASHNPPSDNAVKVYWSTGGQVLPPHDKAIIERVMSCQAIKTVPFEEALSNGRVEIVTETVDELFLDAASACRFDGPRDVRVLYTPLHGVGAAVVMPLLSKDGFKDVEVYQPHAEPSGDFPNVPGHVSNPENTAVFDAPIDFAKQSGHEVILATDPDCDRLGVAAPVTNDTQGDWGTFNGNQIAALLADYVLRSRKASDALTPKSFIIKTLVTTELVRKIASHYGARCEGNLLVGYKHIAGVIDAVGPEDFVYGCEESHGYLVGQYARDKDGAVACMLLSELAASLKAAGHSLHDRMAELYTTHGYHLESLTNVFMEGSQGMAAMQSLMATFRTDPPTEIGGMGVAQVRDYQSLTTKQIPDGSVAPLDGPEGNLVILDLAEPGNYVAVRPSGTEPKVKFYLFTSLSADDSQDLPRAETLLSERVAAIQASLKEFALS
ncbi:MAG: phospho-sugar mutase [Planctomycetota bacterium]